MLYAFLKTIVRLALAVFFKQIKHAGMANAPAKGPLIVVANHPNTFMDPILVAAQLRQPVFFLSNASVFVSPLVNWLLRLLHMIPVYRQQDVKPGTSPDNRAVFSKCFEFLEGKGTLLIFPEGTSVLERRLRPLKTGTARIALEAEARHGFALGLKILPIGLNYSDATRFRGEVFVNIGPCLDLHGYAARHAADPVAAVRDLTADIQTALERLTVVARDKRTDLLAAAIEEVYAGSLPGSGEKAANKPGARFVLAREIIAAIDFYGEHDEARVLETERKIQQYHEQAAALRLNRELLGAAPKSGVLTGFVRAGAILAAGCPFYLYGLLHNYLPYVLPAKTARLVSREPEYRAPLMLVSGMFYFTAWYALLLFVAASWLGWTWPLLAYAASLPASGFAVLAYWDFLKRVRAQFRILSAFYRSAETVAALVSLRQELVTELEAAQKAYQAHKKG